MKVEITNLWNTCTLILKLEDSGEFDKITLKDLKKCSNILIGDKIHGSMYEVIINNSLYSIEFKKVNHPTGCGNIQICEIN